MCEELEDGEEDCIKVSPIWGCGGLMLNIVTSGVIITLLIILLRWHCRELGGCKLAAMKENKTMILFLSIFVQITVFVRLLI
jgi:hypothetical protein